MGIIFSVLYIMLIFLIGVFAGVYQAYWVKYLWDWFLVPIGVPKVTVMTLFGIMVIANLIFSKNSKIAYGIIKNQKDLNVINEVIEPVITFLLIYPMVVGMMAIVRWWFN